MVAATDITSAGDIVVVINGTGDQLNDDIRQEAEIPGDARDEFILDQGAGPHLQAH